MELISIYFLAFAIAAAFLYYPLNQRGKILLLNLISCGFIASLSINLLIYLFTYTALNYFIANKIPDARYKKALFRFGVFINILQLLVLNYTHFTLDPLFHFLNFNFELSIISKIILPLGVSYYTLQGIGYLVNVKMGWEKPEKNYQNLLLYFIFFPKFLSGPIERSNKFLPQIRDNVNMEQKNLTMGLRLILWGLFKKLIIANHLGPFIEFVYSGSGPLGSNYAWTALLIQPLYLYFDFSGYTDIALGLGKLYGINLRPNFNRPFLSENITVFWKRFHMSLSSWFNDYVFNQLSFKLRKRRHFGAIIALFVTWELFGIWHGAGWNFMILGLVFSLEIIYEYFTRKIRYKFFSRLPNFIRFWSGRLCTYLFYGTALTFFFSPDLDTTMRLFGSLFDSHEAGPVFPYARIMSFGVALALVYLFVEVLHNDYENIYKKLLGVWNTNRILRILVYYITTFIIVSEISASSTFVYQMF